MCGIFGYIGKENIIINRNILPHRGPDDWGVVNCKIFDKNIILFQSRLSIIGLGKQGAQPFKKYNEQILIFNGEIYNYIEIRERLINEFKISFITNTDTEVLYEALINWGVVSTLDIINGMFGFSYYDKTNDNIYIVRDPLGIKPVYFSKEDVSFVFSSEIKSFFYLNLRKPKLNKDYLGEYFANGWIYEPNTLFDNIYKLEAGHFLKYDIPTGNLTNIKYWDISDDINVSVKPNIKSIVKNQTISDVPIGNYFSGGIDSSIITYILKDRNLLNLNMSLGDDESLRVKAMQQAYDINVKSIYYQKENLETYKNLIYYLDEPIADPAIIPAFQLAKKARELGYIVMMSGMGGDEIDAGYSRHRIISHKGLLLLGRLIPKILVNSLFKGKIKRDLLRLKEFSNDPTPANYFSLTSYFSKSEISNLLNSNKWFDNYKNKTTKICEHIYNNKKFFYLDIKGFLSSHNLIYMDKASMAASVEVRVPLLDKNLVKYYFKDIDKKEYAGKKRLKSYLKSLIGDNYQEINKAGFRYEINNWLLNDIDWKTIISFFQNYGLINVKVLKSYIHMSKQDIDSVSMKLWSIYTLYLWIKTFDVRVPKTNP